MHRKNKRVPRATQHRTRHRPRIISVSAAEVPITEVITAAATQAATQANAATPGFLCPQTVDAEAATPEKGRFDDTRRRQSGGEEVTAAVYSGSSHLARGEEDTSQFSSTATTGIQQGTDNTSDAGSSSRSTTDSSVVLHGHGDGEYKKYLVEFIDQPQITERPLDKHARVMYVGSAFSNINFLLRQRFSTDRTRHNPVMSHYPTNRIARQHTCHYGDADGGLPLEAFQLPPKRTVDQLLTAYFTHINPGFPVVDEVLFMRQYRARDSQNPPSLLLLQAILVVGAHVLYNNDGPDRHRDTQKAIFFRRAKILLDARFEHTRDTVVQAALLMTWHADGPEDVGANAWFWVGFAARTAMGLGMHRDADTSTLVPHNKRMWRRVWWLLVQCDVLVALQYGRPQAVHLEDTDVKSLVPLDFQDCGPCTQIDFVIQMTELCRILSTKVLQHQFRRNSIGSSDSTTGATPTNHQRAALRKTDEALANWSLHLPPALQLGASAVISRTNNDDVNVWTASLHLVYNMALILLHRQQPQVTPKPDGDRSEAETVDLRHSDDVEICTNAAVAIQQVFHNLCAGDQMRYLWSSAINCLFTALIQLSLEVRMSNPVLAVAALRRYDSALSALRQLADYWPNAQAVVQFFQHSVRLQSLRGGTAIGGTRRSDKHVAAAAAVLSHMRSEDGLQQVPIEEDEPFLDTNLAHDVAGLTNAEMRDAPQYLVDAEDTLLTQHHDLETDSPDITQLLSSLMSTRNAIPSASGLTLVDPWNDWQKIYWQQPASTDDFLFSF